MDNKDLTILEMLQEDCSLPVAEIAGRVALSPTPCWRRIQKLEQEGYIRQRVALADRELMGCPVSVLVALKTRQHDAAWIEKFREAVAAIPEIVEAYRLSGEIDYLLRVVVPDIAAYDAVYKDLVGRVSFADVSSSFSMEEIKFTTALPTKFLRAGG